MATIVEAAARKAPALADLGDEEPAPWWQRQSALPLGVLSHELRPGGARPGPAAAWAQVDAAVASLGDAMQSHSLPAEQQALEELSLGLCEVVDRLVQRDVYPWPTTGTTRATTPNPRIKATAKVRQEVFRERFRSAQYGTGLRPRCHWDRGLGCA